MRTNGGACGPWMRWSKDQMMIDDDGGVMFNIACRLGTGTLWDAPRVFYCETPVSSVSRVMCNPELFICTNLVFDSTLSSLSKSPICPTVSRLSTHGAESGPPESGPGSADRRENLRFSPIFATGR